MSGKRNEATPGPRMARVPALGWPLAALMLFALPAAGKDYSIRQVDIEAQLDASGGLAVSEARTYDFEDNFRYAYRTLPLREGVEYAEIGVFDGEQPYVEGGEERPGTYRITRREDEIEVRWFFRARDESRTFTLRYRLTGGLRVHEDAAVLYCQFIGPDWSVSNRHIEIRVHPPEPIAATDVQHWWHGPLWAEATSAPDGTITLGCERLPPRQFLEVRALYPPRLFPGAPAQPGTVRAQIQEEEARWAEQANERRAAARAAQERRARLGWIGLRASVLLSGLGLFGWWLLFQRYGRRGEASGWAPPPRRGEGDLAPAFVDHLMHDRQVSALGLVATLMDLARRGYLTLREERVEKRGLFGGERQASEYRLDLRRADYLARAGDLLPHEASLMRFLFEECFPGAEGFRLSDLRKRRREVTAFFGRWTKEVKAQARELRHYDPESLRGMRRSLVLGAAMIVLGAGAALLCGPWALILIGSGVLVLLLSLVIVRRTPGGEEEHRRFRELRRTLQGFAARGGLGGEALERIDLYLIYGLVLGLGAKRLQALAASLPAEALGSHFPWYAAHAGSSPASFASSFSAMVATAGSTFSSVSGAGGGASGGGGGGAGGGGGGAG